MRRFVVCRTLGGNYHSYGVEDRAKIKLLPIIFNLTKEEAEEEAERLNKKKINWWDKLMWEKEINELKEKEETKDD